jgi:dihydroorotate dehydrogenase (fumarate)
LSGADAVQMVSALLRYGSQYVEVMRRGLTEWMEQHEIACVEDMRGQASLHGIGNPQALERAGYICTLQSWGQERHGHDTHRARARTI